MRQQKHADRVHEHAKDGVGRAFLGHDRELNDDEPLSSRWTAHVCLTTPGSDCFLSHAGVVEKVVFLMWHEFDRTMEARDPIAIGDRVRILRGNFQGMDATVESVDASQQSICVAVHMFRGVSGDPFPSLQFEDVYCYPRPRLIPRYRYVGPSEISDRANPTSPRLGVSFPRNVRAWYQAAEDAAPLPAQVTATFVIDVEGKLWIADRRSEHVACARRQPVFSAGEMTFDISSDRVEATWITNQSTGYCPEPESWPVVAHALDNVGIGHNHQFDACYHFRRCNCGQINLVKDEEFVCCVCESDLSREWNFASRIISSRSS